MFHCHLDSRRGHCITYRPRLQWCDQGPIAARHCKFSMVSKKLFYAWVFNLEIVKLFFPGFVHIFGSACSWLLSYQKRLDLSPCGLGAIYLSTLGRLPAGLSWLIMMWPSLLPSQPCQIHTEAEHLYPSSTEGAQQAPVGAARCPCLLRRWASKFSDERWVKVPQIDKCFWRLKHIKTMDGRMTKQVITRGHHDDHDVGELPQHWPLNFRSPSRVEITGWLGFMGHTVILQYP